MDNYRPLDITVISASDLQFFNFFFRMKVYVVVKLINRESVVIEKKTHSCRGKNPRWNHRVKFSVEESAIQTGTLLFVLRCGSWFGYRDIGEVSIPVRELLQTSSDSNTAEHVVDYQVRSIRGKPKGTFTFSHQVKENALANKPAGGCTPPCTTYMAGQQGMPGYPQPPYAPPPGYANYPGPQYGGAWYQPAAKPGAHP